MKTEYFLGERVSSYGISHNRVDYYTLSKTFNHVLANDIWRAGFKKELIHGEVIDASDVYQVFIIDENGIVANVMPKVKPDTNAADILELL